MEAAEDGEQEAGDNREWNSQEHRDYPVAPDPADFEESVTPYPHSVAAANRHGLSNHILKGHLKAQRGGENLLEQRVKSSVLLFHTLIKYTS